MPTDGSAWGSLSRVGVEIPPPKTEVAVPASALAEESGRTSVLIQPDGNTQYIRRQVAVTRRAGGKVFVRGNISAEEKARGLEPLLPGRARRHVTGGFADGQHGESQRHFPEPH